MIFQDPYNALNPRHTVGKIISARHSTSRRSSPTAASRRPSRSSWSASASTPSTTTAIPNEFSGGQRQRIGIARAIALRPKLIVCDEPVTALDVSIQAQILNLLRDLQQDFGIAYLFVAHDLAVVRQISHRVTVMYLGKIMESAPRQVIYSTPLHPYTHSLLSAVPIPNPEEQRHRTRIVLRGDVPSPIDPPSGCVFRTRCFQAREKCADEIPPLIEVAPGHMVACHFPVTVGDLPAALRESEARSDVGPQSAGETVIEAPIEAPSTVSSGIDTPH